MASCKNDFLCTLIWPFDFSFSAPSQAPTNLSVTINNSTSVSVNWQLPPEISRNGVILGFTLYYRKNGTSGQANTATVHDGTVLSTTITGLGKFTGYEFQVSAFTYAGEGPRSSVVTERTSEDGKTCTVNVRMKTRTCTWTILSAKLICVRLRILGFHTWNISSLRKQSTFPTPWQDSPTKWRLWEKSAEIPYWSDSASDWLKFCFNQ